jgi:hypothetical protein
VGDRKLRGADDDRDGELEALEGGDTPGRALYRGIEGKKVEE